MFLGLEQARFCAKTLLQLLDAGIEFNLPVEVGFVLEQRTLLGYLLFDCTALKKYTQGFGEEELTITM